jgi:hypothetical protein
MIAIHGRINTKEFYMETKMIQNKTEKETTPTTLITEKQQPATSERPPVRRRSRRRLPAW